MTILVTALPGRLCHDPGDTGAHRQAGALLRLLHDAEPPRPLEDFQHWLTGRVGSWREQAAGLLSASERRIIDQHLAALRMLGVPSGGVCHLDYQPRNWLLDHSGTLRVIDFEHTRLDPKIGPQLGARQRPAVVCAAGWGRRAGAAGSGQSPARVCAAGRGQAAWAPDGAPSPGAGSRGVRVTSKPSASIWRMCQVILRRVAARRS